MAADQHSATDMARNQLFTALGSFGQEHLLSFWDTLAADQRESLARQIEAIDFKLVWRLFEGARPARTHRRAWPREPSRRRPYGWARHRRAPRRRPCCAVSRRSATGNLASFWSPAGRGLGWASIGPRACSPSGRCRASRSFRLHVEKIVAAGRRYGVRIPLYLMTSPATHDRDGGIFRRTPTGSGCPRRMCFCSARGPCRRWMPRPAGACWSRRGKSPSALTGTAAC